MASYDLPQIQRARFSIEPNGSFGVDRTTDVATNFFDLKHEPTRLMRSPVIVEDDTVVQFDFQRRNDIAGPNRASMELMSHWCSTGQALDATTSPTKTRQSQMMEALLGGYYADQGSAVEASPTPTTTGCTVASGHGARFRVGQVVAFVIGGRAEPVILTDVATDALTWWPALPSAPASAAVVYNAQNIFLTGQPSTTIQALVEAANQRKNTWLGLGGQGDFSLDLTRNQLAKWSSTLQFARFLQDDAIATPQSGNAIGRATYDGGPAVVAFKGGCHFGPSSSTTRALVPVSDVSVTFGRAWMEVGLHSGVEGLDAWQCNTRERITIDLTLLNAASSTAYDLYHDAWEAGTDYGLALWLDGGGAGQGRALFATTCQIVTAPEPTEAFGLEGHKLTLLVKENGRSVDLSTEQRRSPIVLGHY